MKLHNIKWLVMLAVFSSTLVQAQAPARTPARSIGQQLYLPIYSHIWHGDADNKGLPTRTLVSISVSIRNTDPAKSIRILSAQYYDTDGKKIRDYVPAAKTIGPMGTLELFIPRSDDTGGSGANFVISWKSDSPVSPPMVEGVHANLPAGRAIAFITSAQAIPAE